ncbi:hypothetical protein DPMN_153527 [Dreissena polymorpha]|uniref:Uncharacterized protein n=1 Tax=Dreissena polymorpha TaxID=45954 RepID=A0A9D4FKZ3_DREPO|nr:hypothetical protein DPMN_153527 [Dreissena polymorpha]
MEDDSDYDDQSDFSDSDSDSEENFADAQDDHRVGNTAGRTAGQRQTISLRLWRGIYTRTKFQGNLPKHFQDMAPDTKVHTHFQDMAPDTKVPAGRTTPKQYPSASGGG